MGEEVDSARSCRRAGPSAPQHHPPTCQGRRREAAVSRASHPCQAVELVVRDGMCWHGQQPARRRRRAECGQKQGTAGPPLEPVSHCSPARTGPRHDGRGDWHGELSKRANAMRTGAQQQLWCEVRREVRRPLAFCPQPRLRPYTRAGKSSYAGA